MSTYAERLELPRIMRDLGLDPLLIRGWRSHARPPEFDPMALMYHWTATRTASLLNPMPTLGVVRDGWGALPGPLYNILVGQDGRVAIISIGTCNHAGMGNRAAFDAARAAGRRLAWSHRPGADSMVPNRLSWGISADHSGTGPLSPHQRRGLVLAGTAVCILENWSSNRGYHHASSTRRKVDVWTPSGTRWPDFVPEISEHLRSGRSGGSSGPEPGPEEEAEVMHYGQSDKRDFGGRPVIQSLQRTLNRFHVDTADMPNLPEYEGKRGVEVLDDLDGGSYNAHGVRQRHLREDGVFGSATRRAVWSAIHRTGWILGFSVRPDEGTRHDVVTQDLVAYLAQAHMEYRRRYRS